MAIERGRWWTGPGMLLSRKRSPREMGTGLQAWLDACCGSDAEKEACGLVCGEIHMAVGGWGEATNLVRVRE